MIGEDDDDDGGGFGGSKYPCMPSLVALQQMRNRLHLAFLGKKLMKWTAMATGRELRRIAQELDGVYGNYREDIRAGYLLLARARYFNPDFNKVVIENHSKIAQLTTVMSSKTISGVRVVQYEVRNTEVDWYQHLGIEKGGQVIRQAKEIWRELLLRMVRVLEMRTSFSLVDAANKSATKKFNVLSKLVIPKILASLHYILSELEEKEREENFRLKRFKQLKVQKQQDKLKVCRCCYNTIKDNFGSGEGQTDDMCEICRKLINVEVDTRLNPRIITCIKDGEEHLQQVCHLKEPAPRNLIEEVKSKEIPTEQQEKEEEICENKVCSCTSILEKEKREIQDGILELMIEVVDKCPCIDLEEDERTVIEDEFMDLLLKLVDKCSCVDIMKQEDHVVKEGIMELLIQIVYKCPCIKVEDKERQEIEEEIVQLLMNVIDRCSCIEVIEQGKHETEDGILELLVHIVDNCSCIEPIGEVDTKEDEENNEEGNDEDIEEEEKMKEVFEDSQEIVDRFSYKENEKEEIISKIDENYQKIDEEKCDVEETVEETKEFCEKPQEIVDICIEKEKEDMSEMVGEENKIDDEKYKTDDVIEQQLLKIVDNCPCTDVEKDENERSKKENHIKEDRPVVIGPSCIAVEPPESATYTEYVSEERFVSSTPYLSEEPNSCKMPCITQSLPHSTDSTCNLSYKKSNVIDYRKTIIVRSVKTQNNEIIVETTTETVKVRKNTNVTQEQNSSKHCHICNCEKNYRSDKGSDDDKGSKRNNNNRNNRDNNNNNDNNDNNDENNNKNCKNNDDDNNNNNIFRKSYNGVRETQSECVRSSKCMADPKLRSCVSASCPKAAMTSTNSTQVEYIPSCCHPIVIKSTDSEIIVCINKNLYVPVNTDLINTFLKSESETAKSCCNMCKNGTSSKPAIVEEDCHAYNEAVESQSNDYKSMESDDKNPCMEKNGANSKIVEQSISKGQTCCNACNNEDKPKSKRPDETTSCCDMCEKKSKFKLIDKFEHVPTCHPITITSTNSEIVVCSEKNKCKPVMESDIHQRSTDSIGTSCCEVCAQSQANIDKKDDCHPIIIKSTDNEVIVCSNKNLCKHSYKFGPEQPNAGRTIKAMTDVAEYCGPCEKEVEVDPELKVKTCVIRQSKTKVSSTSSGSLDRPEVCVVTTGIDSREEDPCKVWCYKRSIPSPIKGGPPCPLSCTFPSGDISSALKKYINNLKASRTTPLYCKLSGPKDQLTAICSNDSMNEVLKEYINKLKTNRTPATEPMKSQVSAYSVGGNINKTTQDYIEKLKTNKVPPQYCNKCTATESVYSISSKMSPDLIKYINYLKMNRNTPLYDADQSNNKASVYYTSSKMNAVLKDYISKMKINKKSPYACSTCNPHNKLSAYSTHRKISPALEDYINKLKTSTKPASCSDRYTNKEPIIYTATIKINPALKKYMDTLTTNKYPPVCCKICPPKYVPPYLVIDRINPALKEYINKLKFNKEPVYCKICTSKNKAISYNVCTNLSPELKEYINKLKRNRYPASSTQNSNVSSYSAPASIDPTLQKYINKLKTNRNPVTCCSKCTLWYHVSPCPKSANISQALKDYINKLKTTKSIDSCRVKSISKTHMTPMCTVGNIKKVTKDYIDKLKTNIATGSICNPPRNEELITCTKVKGIISEPTREVKKYPIPQICSTPNICYTPSNATTLPDICLDSDVCWSRGSEPKICITPKYEVSVKSSKDYINKLKTSHSPASCCDICGVKSESIVSHRIHKAHSSCCDVCSPKNEVSIIFSASDYITKFKCKRNSPSYCASGNSRSDCNSRSDYTNDGSVISLSEYVNKLKTNRIPASSCDVETPKKEISVTRCCSKETNKLSSCCDMCHEAIRGILGLTEPTRKNAGYQADSCRKECSFSKAKNYLSPKLCSTPNVCFTPTTTSRTPSECFASAVCSSEGFLPQIYVKPKIKAIHDYNNFQTKDANVLCKDAQTSTTGLYKLDEIARKELKKNFKSTEKSKSVCTIKIRVKVPKDSNYNERGIITEGKSVTGNKLSKIPKSKSVDDLKESDRICKNCLYKLSGYPKPKKAVNQNFYGEEPRCKYCDILTKESITSMSCKSMGVGSTCSRDSSGTYRSVCSGSQASQAEKNMYLGSATDSHVCIKLAVSTSTIQDKKRQVGNTTSHSPCWNPIRTDFSQNSCPSKKPQKVSSDFSINYRSSSRCGASKSSSGNNFRKGYTQDCGQQMKPLCQISGGKINSCIEYKKSLKICSDHILNYKSRRDAARSTKGGNHSGVNFLCPMVDASTNTKRSCRYDVRSLSDLPRRKKCIEPKKETVKKSTSSSKSDSGLKRRFRSTRPIYSRSFYEQNYRYFERFY